MRKILCVALLLFSLNTVQSLGVEVTATGFGPNRKDALMAAQRNAVEKGIGVLVDSQSLTENMVLVEDKIYTKARGYVQNYTILSEIKLADGNWQVDIQCEVADDKIKHSLKALGILRDKMGNPRIMVIYNPAITDGIPHDPVVSEAYEGIAEYLTQREFPVVAKKVLDQLELKGITSPKDRYNKAVELGLKEKAEYILVYNVKPGNKESTSIFRKGWVMISAKIINTASGQVMASQSKKVIGVDKDSMDFAFRKAGRKAGELTAKFLENKLVKQWQGETVSGRVVVLELVNIRDFSLLVEFKAKLREIYGVRNIFQRNSTSNTAEYEITYVGDSDTFKENVFDILKKLRLKPGLPTSTGDKIRIVLPTK